MVSGKSTANFAMKAMQPWCRSQTYLRVIEWQVALKNNHSNQRTHRVYDMTTLMSIEPPESRKKTPCSGRPTPNRIPRTTFDDLVDINEPWGSYIGLGGLHLNWIGQMSYFALISENVPSVINWCTDAANILRAYKTCLFWEYVQGEFYITIH